MLLSLIRRKKEEGRGKKEEGRRKKEEGRGSYLLPVACCLEGRRKSRQTASLLAVGILRLIRWTYRSITNKFTISRMAKMILWVQY
ncbi:MAG: hypothetical protein ACRC62_19325 [Microcoleus sp.]